MARRTFDVVDIILVHWHAGRNNSEIAANVVPMPGTITTDEMDMPAAADRPEPRP
jgi:hypothetical protein